MTRSDQQVSVSRPGRSTSGAVSGPGGEETAAAGSGVTPGVSASPRGHLAGRRFAASGGGFGDGTKLFVRVCGNAAARKRRSAPDGTARAEGLRPEVADVNTDIGSPLRTARRSGDAARTPVLDSTHGLADTVGGGHVDIISILSTADIAEIAGLNENNPDSGARPQLCSCAGTDVQKWSA